MPRERTLLERLGAREPEGVRSGSLDRNAQLSSIVQHLRKMLNSRQGHALAQMDYGIPDPSEVAHSFPDAIGKMQRAIRTCIEKYEPRLTGVKVIQVESGDDVLTLRYHITARLTDSKERVTVSFDTLVDSSGRIEVRD